MTQTPAPGDAEDRALERRYLAAPDDFGKSGFHGDAARWEALRSPVMAAVHKSGTFLDVGCANGLLLESVVGWAKRAGHHMVPFGLDRSAPLAELARARLSSLAGDVYVGDARTWRPPRRFDFVRTELLRDGGEARAEFMWRFATEFLNPEGRLIVASYGNRAGIPPAIHVGALLKEWSFEVAGTSEGVDPWSGKVLTRVAWVDAAVQ